MTFRFRIDHWYFTQAYEMDFRVVNWVRTPFQVSYRILQGSFGFANFFAALANFSQGKIWFANFSQGEVGFANFSHAL